MPTMCQVTEEKNGLFELELEHPLDSYKKWQNIVEDNIIKASTPKGTQLFRIYRKVPSMVGIKAYARHIFYDLLDNFLEDVRPTALNGAGTLEWILTHTQFAHPFTSTSDITATNSASYVRKNPVQAIMSDDENSFFNRWGGELVRDNFTIKMLQSAGADRGVPIRYKKNLTGLECDINLDGVITRIMPTGLKADDTLLMLPEKYVDSPYVGNYSKPKVKEFHFQDIKVSDTLTEAQAIEMLRQRANDLFIKSKVDIPTSNTRVNFIELSKTEEYKSYAVLETVYLYDTVTIKYEPLSIDLKAQVIKYKYNAILQRYEELELGDFRSNLTSSFTEINKSITEVKDTVETTKSDLQKAVDDATEQINSALGGYVLKRNGELLIMDTDSINTATSVWRWNQNGLGYSSTGYNGNYGTAITKDGKIVADFITVGTLLASLIKSGVLKSSDGSSWLNMDDGTFSFGDGRLVFDGNTFFINYTGTALENDINSRAAQSDIDEMHNYLSFDNVAGLTLGKSGSPLQITIDNEQMDFIDSGKVVAYVNGQKMYINTLQVLSSLVIGVHKIEKYNNDITMVKYVGGGS